MSDDGNLDEVLNENLGDFSLMREARSENDEESVAASVSSSSNQEVLSKIAKLAEGQQVLIDVLTQYLQAQKDISAATLSLSSSSSASSPSTPISVIQPTKVSDSQKINSLDWDRFDPWLLTQEFVHIVYSTRRRTILQTLSNSRHIVISTLNCEDF